MSEPIQPPPSLVAAQAQASLARRELGRRTLYDFIRYTKPDYIGGWFLREICHILDNFEHGVIAGNSPNVMIFLPPGAGKSEIVTRRWPAYILGRHPDWHWMTATYGDDLSQSFGRDVRAIIEDPAYQQLFPQFQIRKDANAVADWITTEGGKYLATSVGGAATGKRYHIGVVDDPIKDQQDADSPAKQKECWDWFHSVFSTRRFPGAGRIIVQTPWSLNDTSMRLLALAKNAPETDQWLVYKFPALAKQDEAHREAGEALHPERYSAKELKKIRDTYHATGNARTWNSMYQCDPVPDEGTYFKKDGISRTYVTAPEHGEVFICLDAAFKVKEENDRTALGAWSLTPQNDLILLPGAFIGRQETLDTAKKIFSLMKQYNAHMLVAGKDHIVGSIEPFLKEMMRSAGYFFTIESMSEKGDKLLKARAFQARTQAGSVIFPAGSLFEEKIRPELLVFPAGEYDDVVDLCSLAARAAAKFFAPAIPPAPTNLPELARGTGAWVLDQFAKHQAKDRPKAAHIPSLVPGR